MYLLINIFGVLVFLGIAFLFSKKKKEINWRSVGTLIVINFVLAWFLTQFPIGREIVQAAASGFTWLADVAYIGIAFALPSWVHVQNMDFVTSALLPILLVVPMFDILTYIGVLPWIIKWIGRGLSFVSGQPKFESFFAVEMMFLGNTEALAVSSLQLSRMRVERDLTLAMMSMSCITASIVGAYTKMMPGEYILTAIPLNIINAFIVTNILNPVKVVPEEDTIAKIGASADNVRREREPFFSFLGNSILGAGKLILIIAANVIAFVALAALIDKILMLVDPWLTLSHILGVIMFPFAWLMGLPMTEAFQFAQYMGTKLVMNEFVVMIGVGPIMDTFSPHFQAILTVFVTSFANFSTLGMIIGAFKGLVSDEKNETVAKNVGYLLLSGVLVSFLSAGIVGLFVW
ncbi:CNT family concentrative nucleoside transporter/purine nucleoside transport protein [Sporomusaceae bacterium BoRhaA]|uniref:NupC/NupG family nucleoside CNT transporter n=1 Tax=Pelorhabdus rhamnosifermentans TaxID=2772457 RepID=UPI001C06120B|nr:nucleoside transporter C-terminal domain-containing protein [Pelorhabdus rhamnosifermentans]MBU2703557.1 CNT family concentrative nucleoside transporter/purine nucleoside transport protein [Pelorhabdus rhamnosifermentans]